MRKDRYSALIIANMIARTMKRQIPNPTYNIIGRAASGGFKKTEETSMYVGQDWAKSYDASCIKIIRKNQ